MNLVALIGNVATAPELRYTAGNRAVCTFRVAVSRSGADQAEFFTVVCWERQAEIANEYLSLGRRVGVEGRLNHTTWESDGERKSNVEIVANRVQLIGSRNTAATTPPDQDATPALVEEEVVA